MKAQIYLLITIALSILLLSCGPKVTEPSTSSSAGDTGGDGLSTVALQAIIKSGNLAGLTASTDSLVTNTLTHLTASTSYASATIEARYATENGAGAKDGTSWANAWAATDLRGGIDGISASATKVYAVLVASGTYKPVTTTATATTTQRGISFSMKNHVVIIGGFTSTGGWTRTGTTIFSGNIGNEGSANDNSYNVFSHTSINLTNGLLYGVTITGGNANGSTPQNSGGGMYNNSSSPRLVNVVFSDNSANTDGGGMYNVNSSPVLTRVEFTGNTANEGGGMYNATSSPVLTGVEFTDNSAISGGGMYNNDSSLVLRGVVFSNNSSTGTTFINPSFIIIRGGGGMYNNGSSSVLRGVVFVGNSANDSGGGMYNNSSSSPVLVGAVFRGNSARNNGGGMYNYNIKTGAEPVIVNSIFADNRVTTGVGKDIALDRRSSDNNIKVRVAGSVLGVGKANVTNGIVVTTNTGGSYNVTYHSLATGAVNFGDNKTTDTATGGLTYPTIQSTSSAKDIGLYVYSKDSTYYFSDTGTGASWHTNFTAAGGLAGTAGALPGGAEDLTATDIAGNARVGRPDAGVHEYTP